MAQSESEQAKPGDEGETDLRDPQHPRSKRGEGNGHPSGIKGK